MITDTFRGYGRIENPKPCPAVPLRHHEPGNALRDEAGPKLSIQAIARRGDDPAALHWQTIGEKASQRGLQHLLLLGEGEFHGSDPRR